MMSRIEQLISEIEEYIDSCKFQALSNSKIIVNKEELEELLVELRLRIPDEIKKYQKIISQQETILNEAQAQADAMLDDAKKQADSMVAQASEQTSEMINEHEIMQRAYAHANEVVEQASIQAQAIVDSAVNDANGIRQSSIQYTDDMLRSLQTIINHTMEGAKGRFDAFMTSMQSSYDIVSSNRNELSGGIVRPEEGEGQASQEMDDGQQQAEATTTGIGYRHRDRLPAQGYIKYETGQRAVENFPQHIMPDGQSGIF